MSEDLLTANVEGTGLICAWRKVAALFDFKNRLRLVSICLMMLVGSGMEIFGIGILIPFLSILRDPDAIMLHPRYGPWCETFNIVTDRELLIVASASLLALFCIKNLYIAFQWRCVYAFIYANAARLSSRLVSGYLMWPYCEHTRRNSAELIRNATIETQNVVSGVVLPTLRLLTDTVLLIGLIGVLMISHWQGAFIVFVLLSGIAAALLYGLKRKVEKLGETRAKHQSSVIQSLNQSLGGIKLTKVLGKQCYFADQFTANETKLVTAMQHNSFVSQVPRLAVESVITCGFAACVMLIVVFRKWDPSLLTSVMVFGIAAVRLLPSTTSMITAINKLRFSIPSVELVYRDIQTTAPWMEESVLVDVRKAPVHFSRALRGEGISFCYPGSDALALDDISFEIRRGDTVGLIGLSGAGKTTLADVILGLLKPTEGILEVDDMDVHDDLRGWQALLGYIPQEIYLSDDSIRSNVAYGVPRSEIDDGAVWSALKVAQLKEFIESLSDGLETQLGERGVRFSCGQRQRVGIARALYHDPELLVLDEPTAALDLETERQFLSSLRGLVGKKTLLIIAHRLTTVRYCDVIYVMEAGRIVASGTFEELSAGSAVFKKLRGTGRAEPQKSIAESVI